MLRVPLARWSMLLEAGRASLWLIPSALMMLAVIAAVSTILIDRAVGRALTDASWMFAIGAEGTRATLSTIAASVMTVAGVAFSMTIVVLQLASSQYTPRVIRSFRRDRLIQFVLGLYTGTFVYSLMVLRTISADGPQEQAFTAPVSVTTALLLAGVCMVALVALIHHVAQTVQVSAIVASVSAETRSTLDRLFPMDAAPASAERRQRPTSVHPPFVLCSRSDGYLDFVEAAGLDLSTGVEIVCVEARVGDFIRRGEPLAEVWPASAGRRNEDHLQRCFALASERTIRQDVRYGLRLLVDIALRALSPSLYDPTTALQCVDALGALLCDAARRPRPAHVTTTPGGVRVHAPEPGMSELVAVAFDEIIAAGAPFVRVERAVLEACRALAGLGTDAARSCELARVSARIMHAVEHAGWPAGDREALAADVRMLAQPRSWPVSPCDLTHQDGCRPT